MKKEGNNSRKKKGKFLKCLLSVKLWRKFTSIILAFTVFLITYMMILPALTIDIDTAIEEPGLEVAVSGAPEEITVYEDGSLQPISVGETETGLSDEFPENYGELEDGMPVSAEEALYEHAGISEIVNTPDAEYYVENAEYYGEFVDPTYGEDSFDITDKPQNSGEIFFAEGEETVPAEEITADVPDSEWAAEEADNYFEEDIPEIDLAEGDAFTDDTSDSQILPEEFGETITEETVEPEEVDEAVQPAEEQEDIEAVTEPAALFTEETSEEAEEEEIEGESAPCYVLKAEGADYHVTVSFTEEAEIPEGAVLQVEEILPEDMDYEKYVNDAAETLSTEERIMSVNNARFFDITILNGEESVEPKAPVTVLAELTDEFAAEPDAAVVHFKDEDTKVMDTIDPAEAAMYIEEAENASVAAVSTEAGMAAEETLADAISEAVPAAEEMQAEGFESGADVQEAEESIPDDSSILPETEEPISEDMTMLPEAEVQISEDAFMASEELPTVGTAFEEEPERFSFDETMNPIAFVTDSFSVYGFVTATLEKTILASDGHNYKVTVSLEPLTEIPEDAELLVEEIKEGTSSDGVGYEEYVARTENALRLQDKSSEYLRLFDISIVDRDGFKIQPAPGSTVDVSIELADGTSEEVSVVHFADENDSGSFVDAEVDGQTVSFETDGFSVYAVAYTVDFTYEGRTWSFPGRGSYSLADVLAVLGIEGNVEDADLTLIKGEDHAGALYLTQADGEYYINSDIAFTDTYELRVRSAERVYLISVTDTQTSADLSDFLKNAVITGATQDPNGIYHVEAGEEYSIILTFAEGSAYQFANRAELTYQMPEGINILTKQEDDGTINIVYKGRTYQVGFHYVLDIDGSLKINYDTNDPDFPRLEESTNVSFRFTYTGKFDGSKTTIKFNDVIERDITFDEPEPGQAYVSKNGTFDETTGTYHYTVKVTASGAVTDVRVKDVISGNVLIVNNDVQVTGNSSSYTDHGATNGFDYTFASMQEGEEITINYSAKIDPSKIPANGIVTADMTRNTVIVTPDDGPPHNASYSHEINLKKPDKNTGVESGTTADGKKLYKWTIDYNTLALAKAGGDTVSDSIGESSRQYMKYHGDVVVKVYDHSGNLVGTRSFTPSTDYTWTYIVPDTDTTPYRYVFEYETEVDQAAIDLTGSSVKLNNDSEGPGGKDSEGITVVPKESTSITKEVVSSDEQEITWISHIHVPESGLSKAVVTDTLPYIHSNNLGLSGNYMLYDEYKEGTLEIIGILEGESYNVAHYIDPNDSHDKIVITFYKDINKTTEGLKGGTPGGRDITVKLTTKVNQDWLKAGYNYPTSYQSFHTNNININGGEDVQAQVKYLEPGIKKTGIKTGDKQYKYTIYVTHVDSSPIIINDIFDRSVLEVDTSLDGHDWNYQSMYITGGDYPGHVYTGDTSVKVDYSDTTDGIQITANNVPLQDNGQYYPTYMITYFLKLKEGVDLEQLAIANGGEYDLTNKALWGDYESEFSFKTTYDYLDKQLLNGGELGETNRKAQYRITFNSAKATLNQGEPMVMTDVMSANLSVDYSSIRIVTYPTGQEVPYSLSGEKDENDLPTGRTIATYTVPDSTMVVITYDADVRGNGSQTIVNTVSVNDEDETITTTKSYGTATEGEGAIASFKIVKVDGYDANKKLEGVKFKIFAENPELSFKKSEVLKELILTTDENGEINLDGEEYDFYFNEVYHIQEIEPLDDYGTIGFDYLVTLTKDMANVDYPHYIYYYNDSMQIKNWPLEGLVVEKQVESPDNSDKEKYYPFRISILKADGTVNTSYNEKNGDDQFVNGVFNFELKDKEQKMFWGFEKGTKYKVEEIDNNGMITSVTYKVFDEDGNVTETKTESGLSHIGTLTQENEIITFKNSKTEQKGALKFTKAVKVNGEDTTTTAANGEYTFIVKGPGTTETVSKTVVIKVENGVATKYKIDDATTFTDLPADKFVVISDLTPGEYTITETSSTNTNMTLASITGGKDGTANVQNKQVTVTVTAGETIEAAATATFTNNLPTTEVEVNKTWLVGTTDYSGMLSPMFGSVTVELSVVKVATNATDEEIKAAEIVKDILGNDAKATMSAPTWSATVSNLPVLESGYKYAVKELSVKSGDTDISSYFDTTLSGTTVNNAPKLTEVKVTKQWKPVIPENTTITLYLYSGKAAATANTQVTTIVLDGTADDVAENISSTDTKAGTKQETAGWTAEFKNLPKYAYDTTDGIYEIKYVVKESVVPDGYTVSYGGEGAGSDYVITGGTITNTKKPGDLELTKKVAGGGDTSKEFEFTIELTAPAGETLAESYKYTKTGTEGEQTLVLTRTDENTKAVVSGIKLKADETYTIKGLPAGTTYKITESDYSAAGYSSDIPAEGKTGTITGGTTAKETVEVTNTLSVGGLTVEKTLEGNATNADKEFDFKVTFEKSGLNGNIGTYKIGTLETIASVDATNITFTEGKAEISYKLKGGHKAVFSNLPDGTKFTVEEISKDADGYETTVSSIGGTVNADKTVTGSISSTAAVTVSYVNTKDTIPVEAAKAWKSGDTAIAWPEDVDSVEFTLYKTVNSQTTVVDADDFKNYWVDTSTFTNPITISSSTERKKASWADLPKRMLVTTTETADGQEVTTSAWYDVTYSVKETKVTFTAASGKETLETEEAIQAAYNPTSWDATDKTITNNVPKMTIEGTKTWNVLETSIPTVNPTLTLTRISSKEGADPETVTPAEGQPVWSDVEGQTNVKKYQFTELDKYDTDGYLYTYSVTEASFKVGDATYTVTKNGDTYTVKVGETEVKTFTVTQEGYNITNTETKDFEFTKIWRDISQQDVEWPEGKQITVTFNASVEGKEKALEDQRLTFSPGTCPEGWTKEISADGTKTTFKISGLAAKDADGKELTYYVVEETVEGYNEPIYAFDTNGTITIKPDSDPTKDKAVNRDYIINTPEGGYELPQTGGPGTRLFTILGSILILGAGVLLWRRRKLI